MYLDSSNETFEFIEATLVENKLDRLKLTIDVYKLRIKIYTFYNMQLQIDSCKKLLVHTVKEEKLLVNEITIIQVLCTQFSIERENCKRT